MSENKLQNEKHTKQISEYIDNRKNEMLADIARLIAIPSVRGEAEADAPFGKYPKAALKEALSICEKYGFKPKCIENAIGYADMNDGELELGILAHMDVVPAADGWISDPFEMTEKDGIIYGRGVSDDKGPAIAALYAMRAIKECGIKLKKNVRLILGSDEECGSGDLKYYFDNEKAPAYCFSPDAEFPLINTEKGRFAPRFSASVNDGEGIKPRVVYFNSGSAVNAVPHFAEMKLFGAEGASVESACEAVTKKTGVTFTVSYENDTVTVQAKGKAAHASLPTDGCNALTGMLTLINMLALPACEGTKIFEALNKLFPHGECDGSSMGLAMNDSVSGALTLSLNVLKFDGNSFDGYFDSRMPVCADDIDVVSLTREKLSEYGIMITEENRTLSHHVDESLPFIRTLLSSYEKFTGKKGECMAIGGGTYVHEIKNGVAFGCIMPEIDTRMHGANELMPVEDLLISAKIFANAIIEICG